MKEQTQSAWILYQRGLDYRGDLLGARRLGPNETKALFRDFGNKALYIRNVYDFDCGSETGFWYIVRDRALAIEDYPSKKDRQQIRRSLKEYEFKRVGMDEMRRVGYVVFCENWQRFPENNRPRLWTEEEFADYLERQAAKGEEFWVGYSRETGEPAMWESVYVMGCMAVEETERLSYRYTNHYPTYGLNHVVANYYLQERGLRYVVAGARTVTEHSNVQQFLLKKMGFRKAYCRLQIIFRFPFNVAIFSSYPFRRLLPQSCSLGSLLRLVQYAKESR